MKGGKTGKGKDKDSGKKGGKVKQKGTDNASFQGNCSYCNVSGRRRADCTTRPALAATIAEGQSVGMSPSGAVDDNEGLWIFMMLAGSAAETVEKSYTASFSS